MESANVEISDETVEMTRVSRQQCAESITEIVARLVGDERKIGGHLFEVGFS
jgi:hypothetical protein